MSKIEIEKLHLWVQDRDTVLKYSTDVEWRYGQKPDYTHSNEKFAQESTTNHPPNSLETLVQNLFRTFEIEANFKTNPAQWLSVVPDQFRMSTNGGSRYTITDLINSGAYELMIGNSKDYKVSEENCPTSTNLLHKAFPDGLLWEVVEVYSGFPNIVFKWRNWGQFTAAYKDYAPTGETIEVIGTSLARVTDDFKILCLEHYYDNTNFLAKLKLGGKLVETPEKPETSPSFWRKLGLGGR